MKITKIYGHGIIVPSTINEETREVDVVFATETPVFQRSVVEGGEDFMEVLRCSDENVRMDRINNGLPVIDSHNTKSIFSQIGRSAGVWFSEEKEAWSRIQFSRQDKVNGLFQDIKDGIIQNISVGYNVFKYERQDNGENELPTYYAIDWMPTEISFTPVQADINSRVRNSLETNDLEIIDNKSINDKNRQSMIKVTCPKCEYVFEVWNASEYTCPNCHAAVSVTDVNEETTVEAVAEAVVDGEVKKTTTETTVTENTETETTSQSASNDVSEDAKRSLSSSTGKPATSIEAIRSKATADEQKRFDAILTSSRAAKLEDSFAIELFRGGKSVENCRHQIIVKASERNGKPVNPTHNARVLGDALEVKRELAVDAILGRSLPHRFTTKDDNPFRGLGYAGIARVLFDERGIITRGKLDSEIATMVFSQRAYGTSDLPLLMESVINKVLRGDYQFTPEQWQKIARKKLVPDYRPQPFYQFETENGMKEIPEGGEIPFTTIKEGKQTIQIKDYGEGFKMTRQAIINDDLDVFAQIPDRFMRDREEMQGDKMWGMIIDNIKMYDGNNLFSSEHANLVTGATSAFGEVGLKNALLIFRGQKALGGKRRINVEPKFLIVPPELEIAARKQLTAIMASTTSDVNVFQNAYELIVERRLKDPDAWYLAADPSSIEGLYYAYLEGEEGVRAEREEKFNTDTINYGVRCNFGNAAIDWRGFVKMTGK